MHLDEAKGGSFFLQMGMTHVVRDGACRCHAVTRLFLILSKCCHISTPPYPTAGLHAQAYVCTFNTFD